MKVVHLGYNHRYNDIRIFEKECVSLAKNDYEVVYITSTKNSPPLGEVVQKGVKIIVIPLSEGNRYIRMIRFLKDVKREILIQNAEVYHIHEIWYLPLISFLKKRGKVIYDSHEDHPRAMFGSYLGERKKSRLLLSKLFEKYENNKIKHIYGVIAATPYIAKRFEKVNKNVITIANYPKLDEFFTLQDVQKRQKNTIFYAGGISEQNGILNIIKAMDSIDGSFILAGNISEDFRKKASKLKGWKKVCEVGYLSREEVIEWYKKCSCGVLLYLPYENCVNALPNKLYEYMAAGMPIVASNFPLWKELIEKEKCGICVNPNSISEIVQGINYVLENSDKAKEMGENGKNKAMEKYGWGGVETKLWNFYKKIKK